METNAKRRSALWAIILAGALWAVVGAWPIPAYGQKSPAVTGKASPADQDNSSVDAQRGALDRFLDSHPEIENEVVGRPSAMSDPNYLHEHPELQAFLESHPLVKADPRAFLSPGAWRYGPPRMARSGFDELLSDLAPVLALASFLLAVLWVLRAMLENRRWSRSFKTQEDLHAKLIEKFASGQDFISYLQSDAGRRLLEWAPHVPATTPRGLPNPIGRIMWSLQVGLVLFLAGLGTILIRGQMPAGDASPLVLGTLGLTVGAGFVLSALISYRLSKHLGLIGAIGQGSDLAPRG